MMAEDLNQRNMLAHLYTGFASQKERWVNKIIKRRDSEKIDLNLISDFWLLQALQRVQPSSIYNDLFDRLVASRIESRNDYKAVMTWSGMGERTLRIAKKKNKFLMVARYSCHIESQNEILWSEFSKYGKEYKGDSRITRKELAEYQLADCIYVCSSFIKKSFIDRGIDEKKIFVNPIPLSNLFKPSYDLVQKTKSKFTILFLGKLSIRKGLKYLFEALKKVNINDSDFEVWFVGGADKEIREEFEQKKKPNWKYLGFVQQQELPKLIAQADVGVFPSIEDGFAQVVPQQLSCGVPVITTTHTGASDVIREGYNGFVVPPFDSDSIAQWITKLYDDSQLLSAMKANAIKITDEALSKDVIFGRLVSKIKDNIA
ncbi:MAG: glycosyltransferase family 4 protein [Bacteroidetes bacterium]|nr:glycosyltransferase family 4 protein [Bacteroidota bacterium]